MRIRVFILFVLGPLLIWTIFYHAIVVSRLQTPDANMGSAASASHEKFRSTATDTPLFILHVGPPKTGTSTIQGFAATQDEMLRKDNIYYLGHYGKRPELNMHEFSNLCRACQAKNHDDCECTKKWKEFEKKVNYHFEQKHNVMVSDETFYRYKNMEDEKEFLWDHLVPLLKNWRVRVVFTYRRYYEWAPSQYHQSYNPAGKKRKETRERWPNKGGITIPSFADFLDKFMVANAKHPSALKKKWEDHFADSKIWVFNMHQEGHFLRNFFCRMVPEATNLCLHLRSQPEEITKNPSSAKILHFDMITTEAHKRGMIPKEKSRVEVNRAVQEHSTKRGLKSAFDFPQKCLSKSQQEKFLQMSLDMEKHMVPKFFPTPHGETTLRTKFEEATTNGKFCSVDVDKVLKDEKWQQFFQTLGSDNTSTKKQ